MPPILWGDEPATWGPENMTWVPATTGTVEDAQPTYQVFVVNENDDVLDVLAPVVVDSWEWALKDIAEAELVIPLDAHGLEHLRTASTGRPAIGYPRVHIQRDSKVVFRGYPDDWRFDLRGGVVVLGLKCKVGHLDHQVIGGAERTNYVENGNFEDGAAPWQSARECNVTTSTISVRGGTALLIEGTVTSSPFAYQDVELPVSDFRLGYYVSCWIRVPEGSKWPNGLSVVRFYDGERSPDRAWWADLPDDLVFDEWVRLDVGPIGVDADTDAVFRVRLGATQDGPVLYDEVRVTRNDALTATPGSDVATLIGTLFTTARTIGDLGYGLDVTPTGRILAGGHVYEHAEHPGMLSALDDWDTDVDWVYRPDTDEVVIGPPTAVGIERTDVVVGDMGAVPTDLGVGSQGVVDEVIVLGDQGPAVSREEGGYRVVGVRRWFEVERAPRKASLKDIDRIAQDTAQQGNHPLMQMDAAMPLPPGGRCQGDWIDEGLLPGDRMWCQQQAGPFDFASLQQVRRIRVRPVQQDSMEVELVEFPEDIVS